MVFKRVLTWESRAEKGKVIVCLISTPNPGLPALPRWASAVVHTQRGGRGGRRRGGGADWEESGRPAAHALFPSNKWAPQRKCKGEGEELVQSMAVTSALRLGGIPRGRARDSASRSASGSAETRLRNVE